MIELRRFVIVIVAAIHTKNADSLQTAKARHNITVGIDKAATFHLLVPQIVCRYLLISKGGEKNATITVGKDKAAAVHFLVPQIGYRYVHIFLINKLN
jgi:hypothetical protein